MKHLKTQLEISPMSLHFYFIQNASTTFQALPRRAPIFSALSLKVFNAHWMLAKKVSNNLLGIFTLCLQGWVRNIKNVALQKQKAILKRESKGQNTISLLNYLKRIAPQQLKLRTQVFQKTF